MTDRETALQAWLQAEHDAVWGFGLIGPRVPDLDDRARDSARAHSRRRDAIRRLVPVDTSVSPATRPLPQLDEREDAERLARDLEQAVQVACLDVLRHATGDERELPLEGLRNAAAAAVAWGAPPQAFPGLD